MILGGTMTFSRRYLRNARLYLVLDAQVCGCGWLFEILKQSVPGVDIVQLRDKKGSSREILAFAKKCKSFLRGRIPLILNDRLDLALAAGVDGVHLGQDDLPLVEARKLAGRRLLIGVSCQTLIQARRAEREGADYIGFGSVFPTLTKPDRRPMDFKLLAQAARTIHVPIFFIGGIDETNLARICDRGVERVAVTRSVCLAKEIGTSVRTLKEILEKNKVHPSG